MQGIAKCTTYHAYVHVTWLKTCTTVLSIPESGKQKSSLQQDVTLGLPDFVGSDIKACNPSIPSLSTANLKWENFKFERAALVAIALEMASALMASENVSKFFRSSWKSLQYEHGKLNCLTLA